MIKSLNKPVVNIFYIYALVLGASLGCLMPLHTQGVLVYATRATPMLIFAFIYVYRKYMANPSFKKHIKISYVFGIGLQTTGFYWMLYPMVYFAGMPWFVSILLFSLIVLGTSLYFIGLWFGLYIIMYNAKKPLSNTVFGCVLGASLVLLWEDHAPGFFRWYLGSLDSVSPWRVLASIYGEGTLSFVYVCLGLWCVSLTKSKVSASIALISLVACYTHYYFAHFQKPDISKQATIPMALLQPNFAFSELMSIQPDHQTPLSNLPDWWANKTQIQQALTYWQHTNTSTPAALVFPESALDQNIFDTSSLAYKDWLQWQNQTSQMPIPIIAEYTWQNRSMISLVSAKSFLPITPYIPTYTKQILMPFGEYVPGEQYLPWIGTLYRKLVPNSSLLETSADIHTIPLLYQGQNIEIAPLVCFDTIDRSVTDQHILRNHPDFFLNLSNYVWMWDSQAGSLMAKINQWHSITYNKATIMDANTGPTLGWDNMGLPLHDTNTPKTQVPLLTSGVLVLPVPLTQIDNFYTRGLRLFGKLWNYADMLLCLAAWVFCIVL
jgi:apolipoprotein N-acyltransferase